MGWVKVNSDRGIVRDEGRNWTKSFSKKKGIRSAIKAELWGALLGLRLARELGFTEVIKSDSRTLLDGLIQKRRHGANTQSLFDAIDLLLSENWQIKINNSTDHLANLGVTQVSG